LILIDGGKGQVSAALKAFEKIHVKAPALIGLAKKEELIVLPDRKELVRLPRHSPALRLLQQVRDEAHRFAVTYQRQRRSSRTLDSELNAISGIGPRRRQDLLRRFGSIDKIRTAELSELMLTGGLPRKVAQQVYDYFRSR
ncbi:MAG: helix-hairpin-helix domain-containing protein, partial [Candidatus Sericytochromatia bacterium]